MKTKGIFKRLCAVLLGLALSVSQIPVTGYIPVSAGSEIVATVTDGDQTQEFGNFEDAIAKLKVNSGNTLKLLKDVTTTKGIDFSDSKTYTIDFNGNGIMYVGDDNDTVIHAASGSAVNLIDSRTENRPVHYITLDGSGRGVSVSENVPATGTEGAGYIEVIGGYITGGIGQYDNGGYISGGGAYGEGENTVIKLSNISIVGNIADYGGGVYVEDYAKFSMESGTISFNKATEDGSGVYAYEDATFTMEGGTISNNEAIYYGGGVYVYDATFTMKGGTISNNEADYGGGVFVYEATFTMKDGTISNNEAAIYGGGVYVYCGSFTMKDGTISNNEAAIYGGGVYVYDATFTMEGGTISNNEAQYGGGVEVGFKSTFTMEDGTISSNKAEEGGSGVYVYLSIFTMKGGEITGNIGLEACGGIEAYDSDVILKGAVLITGNRLKIDENTEKDSNLLVKESSGISISGALTGNIGASLNYWDNTLEKYFPTTGELAAAEGSYNISADDAKVFTSDNKYYTVVLKDDGKLYYEKSFVVAEIAAKDYTGNNLTPDISVSSESGTLTSGTDYTVKITQNSVETVPVKAGTYSVEVTGKGDYYGTVTKPFVVNKAANKLSTIPVANNFTADDTEKALITEGKAEGGTIMYAVTTTDTAPDDSAFKTQIPATKVAGTYYVWYKVDGGDNYESIKADYVKVTVSENTNSGNGQGTNTSGNGQGTNTSGSGEGTNTNGNGQGTNNNGTSGGNYSGGVQDTTSDNNSSDTGKDSKDSGNDGPKTVEEKTTSADGKTETVQRTTTDKSGNVIKETTKETQKENGSVTESSETKTDKNGNVVKTSESKTEVKGTTTETTSKIVFPTSDIVETIYQMTSDDKTVNNVKMTDTEGNLIQETKKTVTQTEGKTVTTNTEKKGNGAKKSVSETVYDDGSTLVKTFEQKKNGKGTYSVVSNDGENTSTTSYSMSKNGEFSVTGKTPDAKGNVVIGSSVKAGGVKHTVTSIAKNAFAGNDDLKSIKLGKKVKKIGAGAFAGCDNLTNIIFNGKVTTIEKGAFEGITELTINLSYVKTKKQLNKEKKRLAALFKKSGADIVLNFVAEKVK